MKLVDRQNEQFVEPSNLPPHPASYFIDSALRAAKYSPAAMRVQVLEDISNILNCEPGDLEFLFADNDDMNIEFFDFPDSERRREIIRTNNLIVAE